jgi:MYXO-CTERM domain-containing protein
MKSLFLRPAPFFLLAVLSMAVSAQAASRLMPVDDTIVVQDENRAHQVAENLKQRFLGAEEPSTLGLQSSPALKSGARYFRFRQLLEGFPIYGAGLQLLVDEKGRLVGAMNDLVPAGKLQKLFVAGDLTEAIWLAEKAFISGGGRLRGRARGEQLWWPQPGSLGLVNLVTVPGSSPLMDVVYIIGGRPARIIFAFRQPLNVKGYAYKQNPVKGPYEEVELAYLTSAEHLIGQHVTVYNCTGSADCATRQQLAAPTDVEGNFLIEPKDANDPTKIDDAFVEVQAYYGINYVHDYFLGVGFSPTPITVQVNYPLDSPNAFYDQQSKSISMGQTGTIDLALENDVIFHEYGHHVFGEVSSASMFEMDQYGPVTHGLAINEATADYYSCSALDDPALGEYFAQQMGPAYFPNGWLRNVDNELTCPWGLYGEAHEDSQIWSGFLWDTRELLGQEQADKIYMKAMAAFPSKVTFPTVTDIYLQTAARELDQATMDQVRQLAAQRGLIDCERFIGLRTEPHTGLVWGKEILGSYGANIVFIPAELHYYIEVPEGATRLNINLSARPMGVDVDILVRKDKRIEHRLNWISMSLESDYDFMLKQGGTFDLPSIDPPFEPGHTYYLQVVNPGQKTAEYNISGEVLIEERDGGLDGADGQDGGASDGTAVDAGDGAGEEAQADAGADQPLECNPGFQPYWDGQSWICVPQCREGYEPKLEGDKWVCRAKSSGCGCAAAGTQGGELLLLLMVVALARRRR